MIMIELISEYKEDLRKHFTAKVYKQGAARRNYVHKELERVLQITFDRIITQKEADSFFHFIDDIKKPFYWRAIDKCTPGMELI